jgi:hypothetical protein
MDEWRVLRSTDCVPNGQDGRKAVAPDGSAECPGRTPFEPEIAEDCVVPIFVDRDQSPSRNASSLSGGRKRPGVLVAGAVVASARSLIPMSACR